MLLNYTSLCCNFVWLILSKKKKNKICQNSKQILEKLFFVHSKNKVENLSFFLLKFSDINIKNVGGPLAVVSVYKVVWVKDGKLLDTALVRDNMYIEKCLKKALRALRVITLFCKMLAFKCCFSGQHFFFVYHKIKLFTDFGCFYFCPCHKPRL